eukprot:NODE_6253_length_1688_cov_4.325432.p2 GENE.NODE_6253_length_1688_cov_4.325432~~NODE_6253_length_1688_cov_4.325432.p2  ORF type:complete len:446 (+),score=183.09 NODE_6253_length_1688_cov_4.325432:39-1376(+)
MPPRTSASANAAEAERAALRARESSLLQREKQFAARDLMLLENCSTRLASEHSATTAAGEVEAERKSKSLSAWAAELRSEKAALQLRSAALNEQESAFRISQATAAASLEEEASALRMLRASTMKTSKAAQQQQQCRIDVLQKESKLRTQQTEAQRREEELAAKAAELQEREGVVEEAALRARSSDAAVQAKLKAREEAVIQTEGRVLVRARALAAEEAAVQQQRSRLEEEESRFRARMVALEATQAKSADGTDAKARVKKVEMREEAVMETEGRLLARARELAAEEAAVQHWRAALQAQESSLRTRAAAGASAKSADAEEGKVSAKAVEAREEAAREIDLRLLTRARALKEDEQSLQKWQDTLMQKESALRMRSADVEKMAVEVERLQEVAKAEAKRREKETTSAFDHNDSRKYRHRRQLWGFSKFRRGGDCSFAKHFQRKHRW